MTQKNYSERVNEVKNDIMSEIRSLIGLDGRHKFSNPFPIHYIDGDIATTENCIAVEVYGDGMVCFSTSKEVTPVWTHEKMFEGEDVFNFEPNSFFNILEQLKTELREEKIQTIRELVKEAGGKIEFDGSFTFAGENEGFDCENSKLLSLFMRGDDLVVKDLFEDLTYNNGTDYFPFSELDRVIEYVRSEVKSPEKMIALTDEQKVLFENFKNAFEALKNGGVGLFVDDSLMRMYAVNESSIEKIEFACNFTESKDKEGYQFIDVQKCPVINDAIFFYVEGDEKVYAKFK